MSDLLPCPFCGSKATIARSNRGWKIECEARFGTCFMNARTHYQPTKYLAENAWNTRADLPATDAQALANEKVKALVEALNNIDALDPESSIDGCSPSALRGLVLRMGEIARTALAALEVKG